MTQTRLEGAVSKKFILVGNLSHGSRQLYTVSQQHGEGLSFGHPPKNIYVESLELQQSRRYVSSPILLKKGRNFDILLEVEFVGWMKEDPAVLVCHLSFTR